MCSSTFYTLLPVTESLTDKLARISTNPHTSDPFLPSPRVTDACHYVDSGDLNSGPYAYMASTYPLNHLSALLHLISTASYSFQKYILSFLSIFISSLSFGLIMNLQNPILDESLPSEWTFCCEFYFSLLV